MWDDFANFKAREAQQWYGEQLANELSLFEEKKQTESAMQERVHKLMSLPVLRDLSVHWMVKCLEKLLLVDNSGTNLIKRGAQLNVALCFTTCIGWNDIYSHVFDSTFQQAAILEVSVYDQNKLAQLVAQETQSNMSAENRPDQLPGEPKRRKRRPKKPKVNAYATAPGGS